MMLEKTETPTYQTDSTTLQERLQRIDQLQREIKRAVGRIEYLKMSAQRVTSRLSPIRYDGGVEHSKVEFAVLETDAIKWGIEELQKELDLHLELISPLIERLPPGLLRAVATQRFVDGLSCGLIAKRLHYSRCYVYTLLKQAIIRLDAIAKRGK